MLPTIWYEPWLDRPAELRDHATPTHVAERSLGGGIRRRLGRVLIAAGEVLVAERHPAGVARTSR